MLPWRGGSQNACTVNRRTLCRAIRLRSQRQLMSIPQWLLQAGSVAGLATLCFTVWDRLLSGRPLVVIRPADYVGRSVCVQNLSRHDILITKMRCSRDGVSVASDGSVGGISRAAIGKSFAALLSANTEREFPLVFRRGELVEEDARDLFPFAIIVSWRKSRSMWLPQLPAVIFTSARAIRRLKAAK
jgi:hypothetical protein